MRMAALYRFLSGLPCESSDGRVLKPGPPSSMLMIGSRNEYTAGPNDTRFFKGHLGEVLLYNRTLRAEELAEVRH